MKLRIAIGIAVFVCVCCCVGLTMGGDKSTDLVV